MARAISLIDRHSNAVRLVCGFVVGYWARGSDSPEHEHERADCQYRAICQRVDTLFYPL
jgi:hypothetical protein